jgi:NAD(P)-dependent dehydrogenase (short-subunit alcohol dehydrogenase family)
VQELNDKVAVVTGGASGIGLAMARAFLDRGMRVVIADIEESALEKAEADLDGGDRLAAEVCDVSDADSIDALRDTTLDRFGAVHVVCNNAGVGAGGLAWEQSLQDWRWVLGVNLWGVIHGIRTFTPLLIEQGEGHIVNTASMAGLTSPPFMASYNVTKHAVVTLSETLFSDLQVTGATGVGVSVLCPGWVQTRIHESGRNRPAGAEAPAPQPEVATPPPGEFESVLGNLIATGLDPADVAERVVEAVTDRRFYILTHPEWGGGVSARTDRIVAGEDPAIFLPS